MVKQVAVLKQEEQVQEEAWAMEEGAELEELLGNGFFLEQVGAGPPEDEGGGLGGLLGLVAAQAESAQDSLMGMGSALMQGAFHALEAGAERVGQGIEEVVSGFQSAAELLAWLGGVDGTLARRVLDRMAGVRADLLEELLIQAPQNPYAAYVLGALPPDSLRRVFERLEPVVIALLIMSVRATFPPYLVPTVAALPPLVRAAILLQLHPEVAEPLLVALGEFGVEALSQGITDRVPKDVGVRLGADAEVTLGLPVVGAEASVEVIHRGDAVFEIQVDGTVRAGAGAGAGGGGTVGVGGDGIGDGQLGGGMAAKTSAEAGLRSVLQAKYEVDLFTLSGPDLVWRLLKEAVDSRSLAIRVLGLVVEMGMTRFHRSTTVRNEGYAEAGAEAEAGIRTGNEETAAFFTGAGQGNSGEVVSWWQHFLQVAGSIQISGSAGVGVSVRTKEWGEVKGELVPLDPELVLLGTVKGLLEVQQGASFLPWPDFPDLGLGGVFEVIFPVQGTGERCQIQEPTLKAIGQVQMGAGELEVAVGLKDLVPSWRPYAEQVANYQDVEVTARAGLGAPFIRDLVQSVLTQAGLREKRALKAKGWLTLESKIQKETLQSVMLELAEGAAPDASALAVLHQRVLKQLERGESPAGVPDSGARRLWSDLHAQQKSKVRAELSLSAHAEASVGAGGKAEGKGGIEGAFLMDKELGKKLEQPQIEAMLQGQGLKGCDIWEG